MGDIIGELMPLLQIQIQIQIQRLLRKQEETGMWLRRAKDMVGLRFTFVFCNVEAK